MDDQRYTVRQAAAYLGLSESHLHQLRQRGKGPVYTQPSGPGGRVFYFRSALDAWIDEGTVRPSIANPNDERTTV